MVLPWWVYIDQVQHTESFHLLAHLYLSEATSYLSCFIVDLIGQFSCWGKYKGQGVLLPPPVLSGLCYILQGQQNIFMNMNRFVYH